MSATPNGIIVVQEKTAALRQELQRWLTLTGRIEQQADILRDALSLQLVEELLRATRNTIEQVVEAQKPKEFPISPIVESQEISLPSFPLPGKGTPVKSRKGGIRLPDPAYFPKE